VVFQYHKYLQFKTTYWVRAEGTCNTTSCVSVTVILFSNSTIPASATAAPTLICSNSATTLNNNGGTLGTGAVWYWYSGSCGGTLIASGVPVVIYPTITSSYFIRAESPCNTISCVSVTVSIISLPSQPGVISGSATPTTGSIQVYSVPNVSGITYTWTAPSGWTGTSSSNSITYLVGNPSGIVHVVPNNSCGSGIGRSIIVGNGGYQINGYMTYYNTNNTPLDSVIVFLKLNNVNMDSVQADINGYYEFNNLPDGIYNITATTHKIWSGV